MTKKLLTPIQAGALNLPNLMVMAPLTRTRAGTTHIPKRLRCSAIMRIRATMPRCCAAVTKQRILA